MTALAGKVALITGAGRTGGMGQATARRFAEAGANVVVTDLARDRPELRGNETHGLGDDLAVMQKFASALETEFGVRSLALPLDVTDQGQADEVVATTVSELGSLDILFNNAGATTGVGWFMDQTDEQWDLSWQVNAMGTRRMSMLAIPVMAAQGAGVIINNISVGGLVADAGYGAYCASKFAVAAITKLVAKEHGKDGIRSVGVCPGVIDTGMAEANRRLVGELEGVTDDEAWEMMLSAIPLGYPGQADDVAQLVAFLASPAARFISGALIQIDGSMLE
ncbi:MAG: SDR family NAD(P)-dependent oxidoreductase [Acidimicrobiia bacterium]|nr:SDR family NAD(P)-dependent oxidoreductase [Acidimicrobiia bacterium]